jgi:hypothetical protein
MDDALTATLAAIREQDYPLSLTSDDAEALVECFRRIMSAVPEDERVFVRADYNLATSALCHPEGDMPRTNDRSPRCADR